MTDYPYPKVGYSGSGIISRPTQTTPTSDAGLTAVTRGLSMGPNTVVPQLPSQNFQAFGRGRFSLIGPAVPDVRFARGPRLNGVKGTLDLWFKAPTAGTARTLAYLTDDTDTPANVIALRIDTQNRPLVTITAASGATAATGTLTATLNFGNGEQVTIGSKTYTFQTTLTEVDGNVFIGVDLETSLANLKAAINLEAGGGSLYAAATTAHPTAEATAATATTLSVAALQAGPGGNSITTTTTAANASWGGLVLSGGAVGGTVVGEVTPSYTALTAGPLVHVRLAWDSTALVDSARHATLTVNGASVPDGDWTTDPTSSWTPFVPSHMVLGQGYGADSDALDETVVSAQGSNVVQP